MLAKPLWLPALLAAGAFAQVATLDLRLTSGGKPAAARVYITDAGGHTTAVPGAVTYSRRAEEHSYVDGAATVPLSPGTYRIRAEKGPEFEIVERKIDLAPGQTRPLSIEIPRLVRMNEEGWYSGDMHIHRALREMPIILRAEDLNVGPVITRHVGAQRRPMEPFPQTDIVTVDGTHVISQQTQEVERNFEGHGAAVLLNAPNPISDKLSTLFPTVASLCRAAKADGAYIDAEKPIWRHVPMSVAFGLVDSIGVVNNHFHPHDVQLDAERIGTILRDKPAYLTMPGFAEWMMDLYYSFLNCGFRIAASAGSASGVMTSWPGYERVYVKLSGPFSYRQWIQDLKAGRSVATNGPLLRVMADGHPPGSETEWKAGTRARLSIQIDSQNALDRIEVAMNGKVINTIPIAGRRTFRDQITVPVSEPGWIAVRCFEPVGETVRYAHSSPFYFTQDGKLPVHAAAARRWADFVQSLARDSRPEAYPSQEAYRQAMTELSQAETIYRKLLAEGRR